jgi:hypothetical protein
MREPHINATAETLLCMLVFLAVVGSGFYFTTRLVPTQEVAAWVNIVILATTGLVLIWYTVETRRLRIQAQRQVEEIQQQTEVQVRPFVIVEPYFADDTTHGKFLARNVGNGTALNVRVWFVRVQYDLKRRQGDNIPEDDFLYEEISFPENESIWFRQPPVYFLTAHQSSDPIDISSNKKTGRMSSSGRVLYPGDAESIFMIRVHFENVHEQRYFVEETIRHRTLKILRAGRLLGSPATDLIGIADDEEPFLTENGRKAAQNWIQKSYTYLP